MSLSSADVKKVARLARLKVSDEEVERFKGQLGNILGHMSDLAALDTAKVEPTAHALGLVNVMRADVAQVLSPEARAAIFKNAPEREGPYVKVPKVIE
ncbi:Asp-tRNA(Asn)/Glu-tRNA(Gln) amidotransferase subunit GatC [bacterium]|nr:MAG: Asp-tRNA(Asn)/Glu-tRNA(Gln) amidotransferase subunit GatC [bacterium]